MADRKVPDDVQRVFDKYTVNFVRRLNKAKAMEMFHNEFQLDSEGCELMFDMFVNDRNQILSASEFYKFYVSFGYDANKYLDMFTELEKNCPGVAEINGTWDFLKELKTRNNRTFSDEELETAIKCIAGETDRSINKKKFMQLISRIKLTRN